MKAHHAMVVREFLEQNWAQFLSHAKEHGVDEPEADEICDELNVEASR